MSQHKFTIPATSTIEVVGGGNVVVFSAFSPSPGLSAYQIAVKNGFTGTEAQWLASLAASGSGSTSMLFREAGEALGGHRAVIVADGLAFYADNTNLAHVGLVIGLTTAATASGGVASIQSAGELTGLSGLTPDEPIYLSANGGLIQSPPITGFFQQLGIALSATTMLINLTTAIEI